MTLPALLEMVADPHRLVLTYDPGQRRVRQLTPASWHAPTAYTPESARYLDWSRGTPPSLLVAAGTALALPLEAPQASPWLAVRHREDATTAFVVEADGRRVLVRTPLRGRPGRWVVASAPLPPPGPGAPVTVQVRAMADLEVAAVFAYSPLAVFTPAAAPHLPWLEAVESALVVEGEALLPLATGGRAPPAEVRLELLAEPGRDAVLALGDECLVASFADRARPGWDQLRLPLGDPSGVAVLAIRSTGPLPVLARRIAVGPTAAPTAGGGGTPVRAATPSPPG